jgi:hypothetical protein
MAVESFPSLPMAAVDLEPVADGAAFRSRSAPLLGDRVEFGGPLVTPIDDTYRPDDADLQTFVKGLANRWRFVLAHMSVNFPSSNPPALSRASVQVSLDDDANTGDTLAFSIFPTHAGSSYDITRGFSIAPTLTVGPVGAGLGQADFGTTDHGTRDFVVGGPELSAHPAWIFQPTPVQELRGATRLVMVIQVPVGRTGSLGVNLQAQVEMRRFRKHRIPLEGASDANPKAVSF